MPPSPFISLYFHPCEETAYLISQHLKFSWGKSDVCPHFIRLFKTFFFEAVKLSDRLIHYAAFNNFHMRFISHLLPPSSVSLPLNASHGIQKVGPRLTCIYNVFVSVSPWGVVPCSGSLAQRTMWVLCGGAGWLSTQRQVNLGPLLNCCLSCCSSASIRPFFTFFKCESIIYFSFFMS